MLLFIKYTHELSGEAALMNKSADRRNDRVKWSCTWSSHCSLTEVFVIGTVSPHVTHFTALKAASLSGLPVLLPDLFLTLVLLFLQSENRLDQLSTLLLKVIFSACVNSAPAPLWAVLHVVTDLPADPTAAVIRSQFTVRQHLRVKEVILTERQRHEDETRYEVKVNGAQEQF